MRPMPMDDPRDNLERANRWELYDFAKRVGCTEVKEPMPALLAVQILRAKGLTNIQVEAAPLGSIAVLGKDPFTQADQTVDAVSDLRRQYEQSQTEKPIEVDGMKFNDIRSELKRRGVKLSRKDDLPTLRAKLKDVQNAA